MKDFIRADFYRLMRSKGFWITEFLLFCVISSATFLQANIHFEQISPEMRLLVNL